jgi:class 3 adenylate cyclase/tetratricopeptide (TPR) repeat protein/predicted transcriptional regulator
LVDKNSSRWYKTFTKFPRDFSWIPLSVLFYKDRGWSMGPIFISHTEKDLTVVNEIINELEEAGYRTWYFERDTLPGTSYLAQITRAIEQCCAVVLVISKQSIASDQVTKEVVSAFEKRKSFFPLLVDMTPPEFKERQPEWGHAIGGTAMACLTAEGLECCTSRIIEGLKSIGIQPEATGIGVGVLKRPAPTPASYTPKHLADKILAARASLEGERKQVTVLFADVAGFSKMSEKMDPEEVHDLISECLVYLTEEIHRYEGTIAQFLGDGLLALFGAPIAHEDAPQRALYAALGMRDRLREYAQKLKKQGIEFNMRIGLNTGLVVVGKIGDDLTMEYTAMGDTVNLASRMESSAEPGTIQVSENTYRLTEGYFEFKPLGGKALKEKDEPVKAYQLLGVGNVKTRLGVSEMRGLTPFVGRQKELDQLVECYARAKMGQGQVIGIVGEPGVGKSRLLLQMKSVLPQGEYSYLEGECLHYGEAMAYLPIVNTLRAYFDIEEDDQEAMSRKKLQQRISQLDERLMPMIPPLQELLSLKVEDEGFLKLEPQQRRVRIFEAIWSLIIRESQNRPVVLAVEDLHWIDKASEEFLNYLIGRLGGAHVLLLLLYRPEYNNPWTSKTYYSQIRVDELTLETSAEMVQSILKGAKPEQDLTQLILYKAAGNPLFMEEFTRTLVERGYIERKNGYYVLTVKPSELQVPETVQGIIAARMDRLERDLKETMQTASVIGREFPLSILKTVTGMREKLETCLLELQRLEFIYERSMFPELEYIFKHALTQQVAYNSLLLKKRKQVHESIGRAIEALYPNRLEEFYDALAFHFKNGSSNDKAIYYLTKAAEKSFDRYAVEEAHRHFKEAYDLLCPRVGQVKGADVQLIDLLIKWAYVFYFRGDYKGLTQLLETHKGLAESLDDKAKLGMYYAWLGFSLSNGKDIRSSYQYLHKALQIGEETKDERLICYAHCWLSWTCSSMGLLDEAVASGERAMEICKCFEEDQYLYYKSLGGWGYAYFWVGEKKKTHEAGEAILEYSKQRGSIRGEALGHTIMGFSYYMEGDYQSAIQHCQQGVEISMDPFYSIFAKVPLGASCLHIGQLQEAEDIWQEVLSFGREYAGESVELSARATLSVISLLKGETQDLTAAEAVLHEMLSVGVKGPYISLCSGLALTLSMMAGVIPDGIQKAKDYYEKAIAGAREIGAKAFLAQGYLSLGLVYSAEGDKDKAKSYISEAISLFEQCELEINLKQAKEALESLK